jgi:hypothetical protein
MATPTPARSPRTWRERFRTALTFERELALTMLCAWMHEARKPPRPTSRHRRSSSSSLYRYLLLRITEPSG